MDELVVIPLVLAAVAGTFGTLATLPYWFDRVVVFVLRWLGIPLFPTAIGVAMSIVNHPEQWSSTNYELTHPDIGTIWIANGALGIRMDTGMGRWEPNCIERRIIRDAVDWRLANYLRGRVEVAMRKSALGMGRE